MGRRGGVGEAWGGAPGAGRNREKGAFRKRASKLAAIGLRPPPPPPAPPRLGERGCFPGAASKRGMPALSTSSNFSRTAREAAMVRCVCGREKGEGAAKQKRTERASVNPTFFFFLVVSLFFLRKEGPPPPAPNAFPGGPRRRGRHLCSVYRPCVGGGKRGKGERKRAGG